MRLQAPLGVRPRFDRNIISIIQGYLPFATFAQSRLVSKRWFYASLTVDSQWYGWLRRNGRLKKAPDAAHLPCYCRAYLHGLPCRFVRHYSPVVPVLAKTHPLWYQCLTTARKTRNKQMLEELKELRCLLGPLRRINARLENELEMVRWDVGLLEERELALPPLIPRDFPTLVTFKRGVHKRHKISHE